MRKFTCVLPVLSLLWQISAHAQERVAPEHQSQELGDVYWYRNYDEAVAVASKAHKDIVILFQEVPGCATCRNYGNHVLTNPLLVDALENEFVPLAIFNNKEGNDRKTLNRFSEPTWNNPVVRIINTDGRDVVNRISGDYSALTLSTSMREALSKRGKRTPSYLDILIDETRAAHARSEQEATFQMYCFWSGERELAKPAGVLDVESGFLNRAEVVKVTYDAQVVSKAQLKSYGQEKGYKLIEDDKGFRTATKDVHYYLKNSIYQYLPLSSLQKTKVNSALGSGEQPTQYLSPSQIEWLKQLQNNKAAQSVSLIAYDIDEAWSMMKKADVDSRRH